MISHIFNRHTHSFGAHVNGVVNEMTVRRFDMSAILDMRQINTIECRIVRKIGNIGCLHRQNEVEGF